MNVQLIHSFILHMVTVKECSPLKQVLSKLLRLLKVLACLKTFEGVNLFLPFKGIPDEAQVDKYAFHTTLAIKVIPPIKSKGKHGW